MIPALIFWLIKNYRKEGSFKPLFRVILSRIKPSLFKIVSVILFIILFVFATSVVAQTKRLSYMIMRGTDIVGDIHYAETNNAGIKQMEMESEVKGRILFIRYSGSAKEEAVYQNGILYRSSIYRKLNGKEKANKQHQAVNNQYLIRSGNYSETSTDYPITYNMLSLYSTEPINIDKVYSDNFQRFVDIKKLDTHKYKINLPDGNTNYYYYQNGELTVMEAHSTWYTVTIVLKK